MSKINTHTYTVIRNTRVNIHKDSNTRFMNAETMSVESPSLPANKYYKDVLLASSVNLERSDKSTMRQIHGADRPGLADDFCFKMDGCQQLINHILKGYEISDTSDTMYTG